MNDPRQLTITGTSTELARPLHERWLDAVSSAWAQVLEPHSPNTREAYHQRWRHWCAFCEQVGIEPLPIEVGRLLGYLALLGETHAPNTVRLALSALASLDQLSRITPTNPNPPSLHTAAAVKRWLESWSRENPRAPRRRAAVIRPSELRSMLELRAPSDHQSREGFHKRYARDRAMVLIGYCSGLRVSNLVALNAPADIEVTDRGLLVHRRTAKNDQFGEGKTIALLPQASALVCPVDAWKAWLAVRGELDGPAFSPIDRQGSVQLAQRLTKRSAQRMIQERATRAGIMLVSSHSLRRSMATVSLERGKSLEAVRRQGDWGSFDALSPYIEDAELFTDNPSSGLLDDVED